MSSLGDLAVRFEHQLLTLGLAKPWQWDEPSALDGIDNAEWDAFTAALETR
jgi:hypothetical protein